MKIILNRDKDLREEAMRQVRANDGYCPCALEHIPDTKCICKDFKEKKENGYTGECNCGLYELVEGD